MTEEENLGSAHIDGVTTWSVGSFADFEFVFRAGHCIDDSGYILIVQRFASDAGAWQFSDPMADNYCTVTTTASCRIEPLVLARGHVRPWNKSCYLQIRGGFVDAGDEIRVHIGDRSGGSRGWRVQTFREASYEFKTLVDCMATYRFTELPVSPTIAIIPGLPEVRQCVAPSEVVVGRPFAYRVRHLDRWGNPVTEPTCHEHPGFAVPGISYVEIAEGDRGAVLRSNPVRVVGSAERLHHYWSDLHGQSEESIGTNSIDEYFRFARDHALLDIVAHQANDFQVSDDFWRVINETCAAYNKDGRFITFPGYEWSGNTPLGGDRNVFFRAEGGRIARSSQALVDDGGVTPDAPTADHLFRQVDGPAPFIHAHVGGRYADMRYHDRRLETAVEIHSAWGTFEWILQDALAQGHRVGVCATSDDHKGRPGLSHPGAATFGSFGGLTCHLAEGLTREAIHAAEMARHFYATTGHRPLLDVSGTLEDANGLLMGDIVETGGSTMRLRLRVAGSAPLERVLVRNGFATVANLLPSPARPGRRIKIIFAGAKVRGRDRMVRWDGRLSIDGGRILGLSPINFWNPESQPVQEGAGQVVWSAVTTGGVVGMILTLDDPETCRIRIETQHRVVEAAVADLTRNATEYPAGGLGMGISLTRLPDVAGDLVMEDEVVVPVQHQGDNPIWIRVDQEDGHMAWTSPIYAVRRAL